MVNSCSIFNNLRVPNTHWRGQIFHELLHDVLAVFRQPAEYVQVNKVGQISFFKTGMSDVLADEKCFLKPSKAYMRLAGDVPFYETLVFGNLVVMGAMK